MTRRHGWFLLMCFLAGCSTHPLVDTLDYFCPGKMYPNTVTPYGGVGIPQGAILAPMPAITIGVPLPPGPPVVPPPVPIPGNRPPGGFQLQPPLPGDPFPPPPPNPPAKF